MHIIDNRHSEVVRYSEHSELLDQPFAIEVAVL